MWKIQLEEQLATNVVVNRHNLLDHIPWKDVFKLSH